MKYDKYLIDCVSCGARTSKAHAKAHGGKCKSCATGAIPRCPDCGGPIDAWKLQAGYHCSACTRNAEGPLFDGY